MTDIALTAAPPAVEGKVRATWPVRGARRAPAAGAPAINVRELVEKAQTGGKEGAEAFGQIYDHYFDTVYKFVYFRVRNHYLAEDLTSETFLRALARIHTFTWFGRDIGAWLITIARNLVADHFRSGRNRLELTVGSILDAYVDKDEDRMVPSPEISVVDYISNVALLTAVKKLNPEQQECLVLRFIQGYTAAETARLMGKNEGAIKSLQYRAIRGLARTLPKEFMPWFRRST